MSNKGIRPELGGRFVQAVEAMVEVVEIPLQSPSFTWDSGAREYAEYFRGAR